MTGVKPPKRGFVNNNCSGFAGANPAAVLIADFVIPALLRYEFKSFNSTK
ncbi:hypothetical protein [Treponema phagedenis]|nr:hypothetical protein [Treponema phagedenis]